MIVLVSTKVDTMLFNRFCLRAKMIFNGSYNNHHAKTGLFIRRKIY
ncbi:hypothetical protein BTN49_2394 [Candidatus Enterovibrio escicola]|uniref:Uncharacterized protein n=1 Tax=Candidatus Enterovibrio escicola TaxID=1927127 RepID=A0A2A5T185_9GAMM|nr:hypothetical protein BTN49_2394 [Candidatus Enterovibrio escacola]